MMALVGMCGLNSCSDDCDHEFIEYDYIKTFVTNVKGLDKDIEFMGTTFNFSKMHMYMLTYAFVSFVMHSRSNHAIQIPTTKGRAPHTMTLSLSSLHFWGYL